jgi:hypothetical protein
VPAFLATLSAAAASNWGICKRHGLWGTGTSWTAKKAARNVSPGDDLFVWQSGAGLIARARIVTTARAVRNHAEVPWPEPQRYSFTFGISVEQELDEPIGDRFKDHHSIQFGIRTHELQAGLIQIGDDVAASLRSAFNDFDVARIEELDASPSPRFIADASPDPPPAVQYPDRRWARPMAGVYLRPASTVTELLLALYRRVADDEDGELLVVGDERDRHLVERELRLEPFIEMRGRVRFVTGEELAAEFQRRFPKV